MLLDDVDDEITDWHSIDMPFGTIMIAKIDRRLIEVIKMKRWIQVVFRASSVTGTRVNDQVFRGSSFKVQGEVAKIK